MRTLLRAARLPLRHAMLPGAVGAALVLPVLTVGWLDDAAALAVLRWTGVLLAVGWLSAVDDPVGEVVAASPYSRARRTASRLLLAGVLVVPGWLWAALLVRWRQPWFPILPLGLEALATAAVGIALAAVLRAWRELHLPAQLATLGLLAFAGIIEALPRWYALNVVQTWGPPWQAAHLRWGAVLLLAVAVLLVALRDPSAGRGHSRVTPRSAAR